MLSDKDRIFTNLYGLHDPLWRARAPAATGTARRRSWRAGRDAIVEEIKASGLRGRGGAGFPTGLKWSFMPKQERTAAALSGGERRRIRARHLQGSRHHPPRSAQADRGLPARRLRHAGACLLHLHPRRVLQRGGGAAARDRRGLRGRADRPNACGSGWDFDLYLHRGAGAYICGEETALLESLEGKKGMPRLKPPFPAAVGLYGCPTTVNNVESIAVVPTILRRGAAWFSAPRPAEECGNQAVLHLRPREQAVQRGGGARHSAARADRHLCRRRARRLGQPAGGHPRRASVPVIPKSDLRHRADGFRQPARREARASAPRRSS